MAEGRRIGRDSTTRTMRLLSDDRTTPEYLAKFVQSEIAKWTVPIKASGISVD